MAICPVCGAEFDQWHRGTRGPASAYCSSRCKQRAYRRRKAGARLDIPPIPGSRLSYPRYELGTEYDLTSS